MSVGRSVNQSVCQSVTLFSLALRTRRSQRNSAYTRADRDMQMHTPHTRGDGQRGSACVNRGQAENKAGGSGRVNCCLLAAVVTRCQRASFRFSLEDKAMATGLWDIKLTT